MTKGETLVLVSQSSEKIVGDPRDQDLQVTVQDMVDIANDPRVNLTTIKQPSTPVSTWSTGTTRRYDKR